MFHGWDIRVGFHSSFSTKISRKLFTWVSFFASFFQRLKCKWWNNGCKGVPPISVLQYEAKPFPADNSYKLYFPISSTSLPAYVFLFFILWVTLVNIFHVLSWKRGDDFWHFQKYFLGFLMTRIAYQRFESTVSYKWTCVGHGFLTPHKTSFTAPFDR